MKTDATPTQLLRKRYIPNLVAALVAIHAVVNLFSLGRLALSRLLLPPEQITSIDLNQMAWRLAHPSRPYISPQQVLHSILFSLLLLIAAYIIVRRTVATDV